MFPVVLCHVWQLILWANAGDVETCITVRVPKHYVPQGTDCPG